MNEKNMKCLHLENNNKICNCTYAICARKGNCCLCLHYHREMDELPACYFTKEGEKTYDRSIKNYLKYSKK